MIVNMTDHFSGTRVSVQKNSCKVPSGEDGALKDKGDH